MKKNKADIGFTEDPDADRLAVVSDTGVALSEEYTLPMAVLSVFGRRGAELGGIAVNLSTSRMCEDILSAHGRKVWRTKVGEANVVEKAIEIGAEISGEGNGVVVLPKVNATRDSLMGIALILDLLAREGKKISEIANELPKYFIRKEKLYSGKQYEQALAVLKRRWSESEQHDRDSIRFDFGDASWMHLRPSNTEPIVHLISEAKTQKRPEEMFSEASLTLAER